MAPYLARALRFYRKFGTIYRVSAVVVKPVYTGPGLLCAGEIVWNALLRGYPVSAGSCIRHYAADNGHAARTITVAPVSVMTSAIAGGKPVTRMRPTIAAPAKRRALLVNAAGSWGLAGSFLGESVDVGTRDADIGQFAVREAAEFAETSVITPPISVDFHNGGKWHRRLLGDRCRGFVNPR